MTGKGKSDYFSYSCKHCLPLPSSLLLPLLRNRKQQQIWRSNASSEEFFKIAETCPSPHQLWSLRAGIVTHWRCSKLLQGKVAWNWSIGWLIAVNQQHLLAWFKSETPRQTGLLSSHDSFQIWEEALSFSTTFWQKGFTAQIVFCNAHHVYNVYNLCSNGYFLKSKFCFLGFKA